MTELRDVVQPNGTITKEQHFDWNSNQKGLILSSFFYGYITTQLAGGFISSKIGGNLVFGIGIGKQQIVTDTKTFLNKFSCRDDSNIHTFNSTRC